MKSHKDLTVWQKSMELVVEIYKISRNYPKDEVFGLVSQMRRAAISIPSNIAEGFGRSYDKETLRFLSTALGSASELETQILISIDLGYIDLDESVKIKNQIEEVIRMLSALIKSLSK